MTPAEPAGRETGAERVAAAAEGQGVGAALVRHALDDARAHGWRVVPVCPFVRAYLARHGEYRDLLAPGAHA